VTITDSTISGNTAEFGGAINNDATLNITRSTIMHNTGTQGGAGIFSNTGTITIINSTFSSNHATGSASGGALYSSQATTNFTNSTVVSNTAAGSGSGIRTDGSGTTTFVNTIIANNPGDDCFGAGTYTSNDYNLDSDNTCNLTGSNDITSTDPLLGSLANNGGPTLTHKPATTSPVVNAGKDSAAPVTDQRGTARPSGAQSDIGSVEIIVILTGVPSLTTWGLLALAAMLGAGVLYGRRRVSAT
jgi:predicted outer membrane repeat protein